MSDSETQAAKQISVSTGLLQRLLDVIENEILPLTEQEVKKGNKIFGAALLRKSDYSTYLVATNNEMQSPLHHGEMHLLKHYFEIEPDKRVPPGELLFFSTHEPCSMCLSAITWAGFDNFYYFFSHEDSRDEFEIPHDLKILNEVFGLAPGGYHNSNHFWNSYSTESMLEEAISSADKAPSTATPAETDINDATARSVIVSLNEAVVRIKARYAEISELYQASKADNDIPLK